MITDTALARWAICGLRLVCLFAGLSPSFAAAGNAPDATTPNALDPQDEHTIPPLLRAQQARYHHLADDVWNARHIPHGLPGPLRRASTRDSGTGGVGIRVKNVDYELADGVGFYIQSLRGALAPHDPRQPVDFDDPSEYDIHIDTATVVVRPSDLDALFNHYLLTREPRGLSSVHNDPSADTLSVSVGARLFGFLPPIGGLPTTLSGPIHIGAHNQLVYRPTSVRSLGLLRVLHLDLATLTPLDRPGVKLVGNQLIMDPDPLFPPPRLSISHIARATLSDNGLTLVFDNSKGKPSFTKPLIAASSYIWLQWRCPFL